MKWQQLLIGVYKRMTSEFEEVIKDLTIEDLHNHVPPSAPTPSVGWSGIPHAVWTGL